jgi:hypothetical protein
MSKFNWNAVRPDLIEMVKDAKLSASAIAARLKDAEGNKPSRNALLGFVFRNTELRGMWQASRKPRVKKVSPEVRRTKIKVVAANGAVVKPEPQPVEKKKAANIVVKKNPVPLVELRPHQCRFPVEERSAGEVIGRFLFCAAPVAEGRGYCATHNRVVYVAVPARKAKPGPFVLAKREPSQTKRVPVRLMKKA